TIFVYDYLDLNYAKIITNSIYVFDKFKYDDRFELLLTRGIYRSKTGSFTGIIANDFLETIYEEKAFIGVNAIHDNKVFNANEDEGVIKRVVLNNAKEKYIVEDRRKFNRKVINKFYNLDIIN